MDQPVVAQPAKKGRKPRPSVQLKQTSVPQPPADALRLLLPDVPPLPEFAAPR